MAHGMVQWHILISVHLSLFNRENLVLRVLKERLVQLVHKDLQESLAQRVSGESPVRW